MGKINRATRISTLAVFVLTDSDCLISRLDDHQVDKMQVNTKKNVVKFL